MTQAVSLMVNIQIMNKQIFQNKIMPVASEMLKDKHLQLQVSCLIKQVSWVRLKKISHLRGTAQDMNQP